MKPNSFFLKSLQFIVYSNIWISLGSALLTFTIFDINNLKTNYNYLFFIFLSTLVSYSIQRLFRIQTLKKTNPNSWIIANKKTSVGITIIATCLAAYFFFAFYNFYTLLFLIPIGIISLLYSYKKLRDVPFIKILLIGISWGISAGVLPFIVSNTMDVYSILINFTWVFLYIIAITIPFDIRDLDVDESNKKTIPQLVGEKHAKLISICVQCMSLVIFYIYFNIEYTTAYLLSSLIAMILLLYSSRKQPEFYFSFGIDGHIILQFLLLYFLY